MVKLFCAVVGAQGSAFPVDIDDGQSVGDLKKAIKEEKKNKFKNVDADDLVLFLAKKDKGNGAWLTGAEVAAVRSDPVAQGFKLMDPTLFLKNPENFGKNFQPGEGHVHVLVEVPVKLSSLPEPQYRQFVVDGADVRVTESMTFNPPALVRFWRAFQGIRTEFKADAVITLPEGTFLLGDPTIGSCIYIRHCYPKLWNVCWKMIPDEATKTPHLVILGNPGIGKTYFGYVILLILARAGKTVVYESRASKQRFLFSQDVVVKGSQQDFIPILDLPTTFYIVDAVEPTYYPAKTILVTSPRRSVWFEFNKTNCQSCYMPVWSWDEIFTCRRLMYSDIPEDLVQDCFRRWGGIARYVLHYAEIEEQQLLLEGVLDSVVLDWLVDACGKLDANPEYVSHRLLHYRVTKDFAADYFVFASQYVLEEIYRRLYNMNKQKLLEFIDASDGVGAAAVLRGHLFEGYVHSVLPRGGTFQIRRLVDDGKTHNGDECPTGKAHDGEVPNGNEYSTGGFWNEGRLRPRRNRKCKSGGNAMGVDGDVLMEDCESSSDDDSSYECSSDAWRDDSTYEDQQVSGDVSNSVVPNIASIGTDVTSITLPERRTVVFNNANGLESGDPTSYLRPAAKNYKSVDAIMKPDILFQVTCAKKHPCKQAGLRDVLKLLQNPAAPALVFVLPPDRFVDFGYQKYHNSKDEPREESSYLNVREIRQFAMEVKTCVGADEKTCKGYSEVSNPSSEHTLVEDQLIAASNEKSIFAPPSMY